MLHYTLGRQISHTYPNANARTASVECKEIDSFPTDLIEKPKQFRVVHDKTVKHIPNFNVTLSPKHGRLFTEVLRRNMLVYSRSLQAWLLYYAVPANQRHSFDKEHIEALKFEEGDVVCGVYEVVKRTQLRVEFSMRPPRSMPHVEGLLVCSLRPRGDGAVLTSETIQWTAKDSKAALPLEGWLARFLHSLTSRYLAVSGAKYLEQRVEADDY